MTYDGLYGGIVVDNADPALVGRVKVRVPIIHGIVQSSYEIISDADLPWALPSGTPAGNSPTSGGFSHIPAAGDNVWVRFLDGELEKPVWECGNQTTSSLSNFTKPLHAYESDGGPVARSAWCRYNHFREIQPSGISDTTANGYSITIADAFTPDSKDGSIALTTAAGYCVTLDDSAQSCNVVAPNFYGISAMTDFYAVTSFGVNSPLVNFTFGRMAFVGQYSGHIIDAISETVFGVQGVFHNLSLSSLDTLAIGAPSLYLSNSFILTDPTGKPIPPVNMALGTSPVGEVWLASGAPADGLVRLSDLTAAMSQIKEWLQAHQHSGVRGGNDVSGPPINLPSFYATASTLVSCEGETTDFSEAY